MSINSTTYRRPVTRGPEAPSTVASLSPAGGPATEPLARGLRCIAEAGLRRGIVRMAWASAAIVVSAATVQAQDMSFSLEDTGQVNIDPASVADGPPSEVMNAALGHYAAKQYARAAVGFKQVIGGGTGDAPAKQHQAEFFLAKSLFHLKLFQSALSVFDSISQAGPGHRGYADSLQWLAQLASELPEPAKIVEKVGRYGLPALDQFRAPQTVKVYNQLLYLLGRFAYDKGELDRAVDVLSMVSADSKFFVPATFYLGMTHVRQRKSQPAIAAFRRMLEKVESTGLTKTETTQYRNLAWLSLGRVYYSAANQASVSSDEMRARLIGNAVDAWNRVEQSSEYWLDALFEGAWAFFLSDEYARALGNVHSLYSPYFSNAYYPEALVIKAVTFFANCQAANSRATVARFHELYDPVQAELSAVLARYPDNVAFFNFLRDVRQDKAQLSKRIKPVVSSALSSRSVLRNLEYVDILTEEESRLAKLPMYFRNSDAGALVMQEVALAKSFAIDEAGNIAKERYGRVVAELRDLMNQVDSVELELTTFERGQLSEQARVQQGAAAASKGGNVVVDEEHQVWPFKGEYWRDELGFYRQQVTNLCRR